jgi:hypothetical protein
MVDMESKSSYTRQVMGLDTCWRDDNVAIHYGRESSDLVDTSGIPLERIPPSRLERLTVGCLYVRVTYSASVE